MTLLVVFLSGCVKVNLLPEDTVMNAIEAGKSFYDEASMKKRGGVRREYSKQVSVGDYASKEAAEADCILSLKTKLNQASATIPAPIVSERIVIVPGSYNTIVECKVVGFIWPKI